jgi:hypothetical protein
MVVVDRFDDKIVVLSEAGIEDEYLYGIDYVSFEFTKKDADAIVAAISFIRDSEWDKTGRYTNADWFDANEEEGEYADHTKLAISEHYVDAVEMDVTSTGGGFIKGFMKYGGSPVYSYGFSWWPLIVAVQSGIDLKPEISGVAKGSGVWGDLIVDVVVDVLTGEIKPIEYHSALMINADTLAIEYSTMKGKQAFASAFKVDGKWRIDESNLGTMQLHFGEIAAKYFGY